MGKSARSRVIDGLEKSAYAGQVLDFYRRVLDAGAPAFHDTKVLYVQHTSIVSGAERALIDLVTEVRSDMSAIVMCPAGPLADALRGVGVDVREYRGTEGSLRFDLRTVGAVWDIIRSAWSVGRLVRREDVSIIHANSIRAGLIAILATVRGGPPVVVHIHDVLPENRISSLIKRVILARSAAVISVSKYSETKFRRTGASLPTAVLYNPIDVSRFDSGLVSKQEAREQLGLPSAVPLLGVVAQITPWKGQRTAVEALAELEARWPDARLLLVGEPKFVSKSTRFDNLTYQYYLRDLVHRLGLEDRVEFLGEREDVPMILRSLDVLLEPSWEEPLGRSAMEAMAMELPTVVTAVGGTRELVRDRVDGLVVPPRQPKEWADAIDHLLSEPATATRMGKSARSRVIDRFEKSAYAGRVRDFYRRVLDASARAGSS
jgi:glycosyltransferase involved in cell wall biosynthesis